MPTRSDRILEIRNVSRDFRAAYEPRTLFRVLRESLGRRHAPAPRRTALRNVDATVFRGDKIAIIGNNGSGKSTLLKIVAGLLRPTNGTIIVGAEMALLTSLGLGMIDEISVTDNALVYGALYGVEPARMRHLLADVLDWAGLAGYEHAKLKTLSSGMRARLAFSVVRYVDAELLLLDEALSAGDVGFQQKARAFFDEPHHTARTFVIATHDMTFARSFCTKALWLHQGRMMAFGHSAPVVSRYLAAQAPIASPAETAEAIG